MNDGFFFYIVENSIPVYQLKGNTQMGPRVNFFFVKCESKIDNGSSLIITQKGPRIRRP